MTPYSTVTQQDCDEPSKITRSDLARLGSVSTRHGAQKKYEDSVFHTGILRLTGAYSEPRWIHHKTRGAAAE